MTRKFGQQRILETLTHDMYQLSLGELRQRVLDYAQDLTETQQASLAAAFRTEPISAPALGNRRASLGNTLVGDISQLRERLEQREYFDGYGWDHQIHEERAFGDDSWSDELTDLFQTAAAVFTAGDLDLAREAYEQLFSVLALDDEIGIFSGFGTAESMLDLDLEVNQAQYLRCIYELTEPERRAVEFAEVWFSLTDFTGALTLQGVDQTRAEELPELDGFLPGWIAALQTRLEERGFGRERELLVEATLIVGGLEALGELARNASVAQAELYLDWILTLEGLGRDDQASVVAGEALHVLGEPSRSRAQIADELASLSQHDAATLLEARVQAFRSAPELHRLKNLYAQELLGADPAQRMLQEVEFLRDGQRLASIPGATYTALLLLAGQVEEAIKNVTAQPDLDKNYSGLKVLLPFLLASGLEQPATLPSTGSWLALMIAGIDEADSFRWTLHGVGSSTTSRPATFGQRDDEPSLARCLLRQLEQQPLSCTQRDERTGLAEGFIERLVAGIVGVKERSSYDLAANLIACRLEVGYLNSDARSAENFAQELAGGFPRHRAFQQELVDSYKRSTVLRR